MIRISELRLPLESTPLELAAHPDQGLSPAYLVPIIAQTLCIAPVDIVHWCVFKRSFDARKSQIYVVYILDIALSEYIDEAALISRLKADPQNHVRLQKTPDMQWHPPLTINNLAVSGQRSRPGERPVVVGFGPCGIFAALALAQMGLRPIILERGKAVRERTKDTWGLWRKSVLNENSNVQFGEGGAGTFSDGKLYSQIKDPKFLGRKVIEEFVKAGAPEDILYAAHPHIGTFKLVKVVENLRAQIIALGAEVRFQHQVIDLIVAGKGEQSKRITGIVVKDLQSGEQSEIAASRVILALGHSARDTFVTLYKCGVSMRAKPFSVGFRIEHPQGLIDQARWGQHAGNPLLGSADYRLVHHASNKRTVYSFCMCPGGTVVAATSEANRVVTNGMSQYSRNERNANAAIVVGIEPADYPTEPKRFEATLSEYCTYKDGSHQAVHPLAGIVLQRELESSAFVLGGSNYNAPAQRLEDFLEARPSLSLGSVVPSYKPGVTLTDLSPALPAYAVQAMREALPQFARQIPGFDLADAVLTGVETRTSSALRIERGEDFENPSIKGLYPAGEGAGYAGGILSAAVDGIKVAEALAMHYLI